LEENCHGVKPILLRLPNVALTAIEQDEQGKSGETTPVPCHRGKGRHNGEAAGKTLVPHSLAGRNRRTKPCKPYHTGMILGDLTA
jgi:hypothetical protein